MKGEQGTSEEWLIHCWFYLQHLPGSASISIHLTARFVSLLFLVLLALLYGICKCNISMIFSVPGTECVLNKAF